MPFTLRELMSEATTIAGTGELPPSRVSWYVNLAMREIANRLPTAEFEALAVSSTSSGQPRMYLPTDCEHIITLSYGTAASPVGGWNIRQASPSQLDAQSDGTAAGAPEMYVSYASWIEFYPSPDSAYSLLMRYKRRISDITSLDAIPSFDTRYHPAVLYRATEGLLLRDRKFDEAQRLRALWRAELNEQPTLSALRQQDRTGMAMRIQKDED